MGKDARLRRISPERNDATWGISGKRPPSRTSQAAVASRAPSSARSTALASPPLPRAVRTAGACWQRRDALPHAASCRRRTPLPRLVGGRAPCQNRRTPSAAAPSRNPAPGKRLAHEKPPSLAGFDGLRSSSRAARLPKFDLLFVLPAHSLDLPSCLFRSTCLARSIDLKPSKPASDRGFSCALPIRGAGGRSAREQRRGRSSWLRTSPTAGARARRSRGTGRRAPLPHGRTRKHRASRASGRFAPTPQSKNQQRYARGLRGAGARNASTHRTKSAGASRCTLCPEP